MFDIAMSEIAIVGVIALVVLGPERLPKVARTAGHLFGRLQRYVATVKGDISREIEVSEFSKLKEEVTSAARSFEDSVRQQTNAFKAETSELEKSAAIESSLGLSATALTQSEILAAQEAGLPFPVNDNSTANPAAAVDPVISRSSTVQSSAGASAFQAQLQSFDLGVERPRRHQQVIPAKVQPAQAQPESSVAT